MSSGRRRRQSIGGLNPPSTWTGRPSSVTAQVGRPVSSEGWRTCLTGLTAPHFCLRPHGQCEIPITASRGARWSGTPTQVHRSATPRGNTGFRKESREDLPLRTLPIFLVVHAVDQTSVVGVPCPLRSALYPYFHSPVHVPGRDSSALPRSKLRSRR